MSSSSDTPQKRLDRILATGIARTEALRAELAAERDALTRQDSDALERSAANKAACLEALEQLEKERLSILTQSSFSNDNNGMQALCDSADNAGTMTGAWQRYRELARDCQQANMTNGAILRLRHQQIASALAALSGQRPETYGPAGRQGGGGSRALAEA